MHHAAKGMKFAVSGFSRKSHVNRIAAGGTPQRVKATARDQGLQRALAADDLPEVRVTRRLYFAREAVALSPRHVAQLRGRDVVRFDSHSFARPYLGTQAGNWPQHEPC